MRFAFLALLLAFASCATTKETRPNVVFILADDLGYGDLACTGGRVPTPNVDRLASEGLRFTDAHSASAVCTPTRYAILTGRYAWRSSLKKGVTWGMSPALVDEGRPTVARTLADAGYRTAFLGKWHLGLDWARLDEPRQATSGPTEGPGWELDYERRAQGGPTDRGYEESFTFPASLDMPPYLYLRNGVPDGVPSVTKSFAPPVRPGPATADFEARRVLRDLARETRASIRRGAADERPFFCYLSLTSPHTPIEPAPAFQGASGMGDYADFLMETDWVVGEVLAELEAQGVLDDTLVIFSSDNGCSPMAKIPDLAELGHAVNGIYRGHKADVYEGGHRIPLVARWPEQIAAGTTSDALVCTVDLFATLAELAGVASEAPDSQSFLDVLRGAEGGRTVLVNHSINGSFALRRGRYKLCLCPGSGGWSGPKPPGSWKNDELPVCQLFDLELDPSETTNLFEERRGLAVELARELEFELRSHPNDGWPDTFHEALLAVFPFLED